MAHSNTAMGGRKTWHKPWPLERAELIDRHNQAINDERIASVRRAKEARQTGYAMALDDIAKEYMNEENMRDLIYRSAVRELADVAGKNIATEIERAWKPHDADINLQQKYRRMTLEAAMPSVVLDARSSIIDQAYTVMRVDFRPIPSAQYCVAPFGAALERNRRRV